MCDLEATDRCRCSNADVANEPGTIDWNREHDRGALAAQQNLVRISFIANSLGRRYRRRATTMPRRKAIANECSGAPRTSRVMVTSGMPGSRPVSMASLTRLL